MKALFHTCLLIFSVFLFAGCGGGSGDGPTLTPGDSDNNGGGNGDSTTLTAGIAQGSNFTANSIQLSNSELDLGDSATLTVYLANVNSTSGAFQLVAESADVVFSSVCQQADIIPAESSSDTGVFTAIYTNNGCNGEDQISAVITFNGATATASTTLTTSNFAVRFGSFIQGTFTEGVMTSTPQSILSAGDTAQLSVRFVDQDTVAYTGAAEVFFSSSCINSGQSEIDPAIASNANGTVVATYTALSCDGTDTVNAVSSVGGITLAASIDLQTAQPPLGALQFVSAAPQILMLKGTEGAIDTAEDGREIGPQSVVTFRVTSDNGDALPNQQVDFELVTGDSGTGNVGDDAFLSRYSDFTDANGQVSTVVNPGTTATPLRVRATAERDGMDISAVSSRLVVTTGIPDQDSFSLSVSQFNIDGWAYDGVETEVTIRAADRFNNPVPNGTALTFWAEGAAIDPSCITEGGACSVTLRSQSPKPSTGRVSILARTIGEETFSDTSPTNGRFEDSESFQDLDEPFLDDNENCVYDANIEKFADFNNDGSRNTGNSLYDGLLCNENASNNNCNPDSETIFVSAGTVIVLSGSTDLQVDAFLSGDLNIPPIEACGGDAANSGSRVPVPNLSQIVLDCGQAITVAVEDGRGQVPPAGTTISVTANQGALVGPTSYTMASTNAYGPWLETFFLDPADQGGDGVFTVTVTTPDTEGGGSTSYSRLLSIIQRDFDISVDQPGVDDEDIQVDSDTGATVQLSIKETSDLSFPAGATVSLGLSKGSITSGEQFDIPMGQVGTFRQTIEISPSGTAGFGFLTVTMTTPAADGCQTDKTYFQDFQVEEAEPEEEAP